MTTVELGGEGAEAAAEAVEAAAEAVEAAADAAAEAAEAAGEATEAAEAAADAGGNGSGEVELHERVAVLETNLAAHIADGSIHLTEEYVRSIARGEAYDVAAEAGRQAAETAIEDAVVEATTDTTSTVEEVTIVAPDVPTSEGGAAEVPHRGFLRRIM